MRRAQAASGARQQGRGSRTKEESRQHLLDTAERLLADHGLEGVSLRQIGAAAGEANNSVIQYHFGDKAGLIAAIIGRRIASFEARREILLAEAMGRETDIASLLKVLLLPLAETEDAYGRHTYARFMMQFLVNFQYQEGIHHPGWGPQSAATRAVTLLGDKLPLLSKRGLGERINWVGMLFLSALVERDNARGNGKPVEKEKIFIEDVFNAMSAVMQARI